MMCEESTNFEKCVRAETAGAIPIQEAGRQNQWMSERWESQSNHCPVCMRASAITVQEAKQQERDWALEPFPDDWDPATDSARS